MKCHLNVWSNDRDVSGERTDCRKEVSEQNKDTVSFDYEAGQRPFKEDQEDARRKCRCAFELLPSSEENEGLLESDNQGKADDEEDLFGSAFAEFVSDRNLYISHGEPITQSAVLQ